MDNYADRLFHLFLPLYRHGNCNSLHIRIDQRMATLLIRLLISFHLFRGYTFVLVDKCLILEASTVNISHINVHPNHLFKASQSFILSFRSMDKKLLLISLAVASLQVAYSCKYQQRDRIQHKLQVGMCLQRTLRSACSCTQSDQSIRCPYESLGHLIAQRKSECSLGSHTKLYLLLYTRLKLL